jgi:hypothetical protein
MAAMPSPRLPRALCVFLIAAPLLHAEDTPEQYEKRIRALEERLQVVEAQLAAMMAQQRPSEPASLSEPAAAPPAPAAAPAPVASKFEMPPELIPEIGKIGAEVGVLASGAGSPFKLNSGQFYGGFIDLPLVDKPAWLHGKISYEILVGLSRSKTQLQTTSNVAQVTNLTVLNTLFPNGGLSNVTAALTGTGPAPFPVTTTDQVNMRLLQVVPFSFKYTSTAFDRWRFRPYAVLGAGMYVTIHDENPAGFGVRSDATLPANILAAIQSEFGGQSPFGAPLVAGQIGQSPELIARGLPGGNGNIDIGLQTGAGFEFRLTRSLSIGFDGRFNKVSGTNGNFATYGSRIGFHF